MTEVFHGVLNMPPELWSERNGFVDEVQTQARHSVYKEASEKIIMLEYRVSELEKENESLKVAMQFAHHSLDNALNRGRDDE